ncbi:MAG: PD40 domain-containing protein, partial [Thermomicrobiaceae bacterium]|nr:PD40 domain-containing protein [Thermomicrobiaceae bacterium]
DKQSIVSFQVFADVQRIAYVTAAGDAVHLATLDGRPLGPAKTPGGAEVAEYVPSPDGSQIAYVPLDRHSVVIAASDGSGSRTAYQVPQPEADSVIGLSWSPDGSKVVFRHARIESGEKPVVMPAEKGASKKPVWEGSRDALDLAWSPDGSRLVYTDGGRIFRVDLATGAEKELTPGPLKGSGQALVDLAWLPADRVAFAAHADGSVYSPATLWLMQSDGTQAWRAIPNLGEALTMRWAPGGKDVVLAVWTPDGLQYYPDIHEAPVTLFAGSSGESHPVVAWERGLTTR